MNIRLSAFDVYPRFPSALRLVLLGVAGAACVSTADDRAWSLETQTSARSVAQSDSVGSQTSALGGGSSTGLDRRTPDQTERDAVLQERIGEIATSPGGKSVSREEMGLNGDFGQAAKFNLALRLHRWDIVFAMAGGYLIWLIVGLTVCALVARLLSARTSR